MLFLRIAVCSLFGMLLQFSHGALIWGEVENQHGSVGGCFFLEQAMLSEAQHKNTIRAETPAYNVVIGMSLLIKCCSEFFY